MTQGAQSPAVHAHSDSGYHSHHDCSGYAGVGADAPGLTCLGDNVVTDFIAETQLPTTDGVFRVRAYRSTGSLRSSEPIALVSGAVAGRRGVFVRVHDQCFTSEVFGSLKCDCKKQLAAAKLYTQQHSGVVIYMPQEGRGIGLANKIWAYALQEKKGLDTVDANRALGFDDDYRSYEPVVAILRDLGIASVQLLTNNPRKIALLEQLGVVVDRRVPIVIPGGEHSQGYLTAKAQRMAHLLPGGVNGGQRMVATTTTAVAVTTRTTVAVVGTAAMPLSPTHSDSDDTVTDESSQDEDEQLVSALADVVTVATQQSSLSILSLAP